MAIPAIWGKRPIRAVRSGVGLKSDRLTEGSELRHYHSCHASPHHRATYPDSANNPQEEMGRTGRRQWRYPANKALINPWRNSMIELLQTLAKNPPSHNLGFVLAILALAFLLWLVSTL